MDFVIVSIMLGLLILGLVLIGQGLIGEPTFKHQIVPFSWRVTTTQVEHPPERHRLRLILVGIAIIVGAVLLGVVAL